MLQQTNEQYTTLIELYSDMIYRYCLLHMENSTQASDVYQDVFLKLFEKRPQFKNQEHAKAWLLRVCINLCRNKARYMIMHPTHVLNEEVIMKEHTQQLPQILHLLKKIQKKYAICLYLYYYEEYAIKEIGELLHKKESTIKTWMSRGKEELKTLILKEREFNE